VDISSEPTFISKVCPRERIPGSVVFGMMDVRKSTDISWVLGNKIRTGHTNTKAPGSDFVQVQNMVVKEVSVHKFLDFSILEFQEKDKEQRLVSQEQEFQECGTLKLEYPEKAEKAEPKKQTERPSFQE